MRLNWCSKNQEKATIKSKNFIAGFFSKGYTLVWMAFTVASPFLTFLCLHAKGTGLVAFFLASGVIGILLNCTFN